MDGAVKAQLGVPDMRLPIQYAFSFPQRLPLKGERLDLFKTQDLQFFEPDYKKFKCLQLCFDAIRKGGEAAKKNMITVPRRGTTVPHSVLAKFSGSKVLIRPASEGTGLIAGSTLRAVLGLAGVVDVLTKSLGSSNPL